MKLIPKDKRTEWEFHVPGDPKGQPRPKAFARKMGTAYVARVYTPGTAEEWKSAIATSVKEIGLAGRMITGPVSLRMECVFARPKSHFGSGKNSALVKASAPPHHTAKPDLDNITKAAKDALTHVGVWRDDSQVTTAHLTKCYAVGNGPSSTQFTVFQILI